VDRQEGSGWVNHARGHSDCRSLQRSGVSVVAKATARRSRRNCRQVPGAGGACRDLLDGDFDFRGRAARNGIPVQRQQVECRDFARAMCDRTGCEPRVVRRAMQNAKTD